jgi:predicted  nucleic acid-binding Zn-ribbon protein
VRPQELRKAVKAMEERIAKTEARMAELSAFLADSTNYTDGERVRQVHAEYEELNAKLPELLSEWESLAEAAEAIAVK